MSRTASTFFLSISIVMIVLLSLIFRELALQSPVKEVRVIDVQTAVTLNEKDRINLFINELLDKKSADCLRNILMKESKMNPKAKNKRSSAKGVGQLLEQTYINIGLKHSADPLAQVVATIAYVSRHYGGKGAFCKAWAFHQKHNYY